MTAGALRLFTWEVPDKGTEAHAFVASSDRIPFRSVCELARWSAKAAMAKPGTPLCQVCREVVEGAASRTLDDLFALAPQLTLSGIEQYQAESR